MNGSELVDPKEVAEAMGWTIRYANKKATKEGWKAKVLNNRGDRRFYLEKLRPEIQKALAAKGAISINALPILAPEAAMEVAERHSKFPALSHQFTGYSNNDNWTDKTALSMDVIRDPRVARSVRMIQEAMDVPSGWKKRAWIEKVAEKYQTTASTIYRQIKKYQTKGLAGLKHTKANRKQPRAWTPEAVDFWIGLCIKKGHRKIAKDALYSMLSEEAAKRGWKIGSYESALWWVKQRVTPQLWALQRGGMRALDNTLPPVVRDYSDLQPFEILVGDQHRFDFWVTDEETGEVFRPEGYFWQDLRTRAFYGGAVDRKYDSYLMGLALRMGLKIFGPFGSIYTDHGKPEESRYIMGIMKDIRVLGLEAGQTVEAPLDISETDSEEVNPLAVIPGTHRKAIVRNAKAKMIEGTFSVFEAILRDHFLVPGYVKELGGIQEENEVDQKEIEALASAGKLLTFREFALTMLKAMDYYNSVKAHRGVRREWSWRPKPKTATPMDCLKRCCMDGWKPVRLSDGAIDLVFLPRATRVVDRGRITFQGDLYEHDQLIGLHREQVEIRFDPLDTDWLLVFKDGDFVARAEPVVYSSMKDKTLAQRKIEEKRRRYKGFILEYRYLTSAVKDIREFSKVPKIEKAAAEVGKAQNKKIKAEKEMYRERASEELEAEVACLEAQGSRPREVVKRLPPRPGYFITAIDRYRWAVKYEIAGGVLSEEDIVFEHEYEAQMNDDQREYWNTVREVGL